MTQKRGKGGRFVKDVEERDLYDETYWQSVGRKPYPKTRTRPKEETPAEEVMHHGSVKTERDHNAGKDRCGETSGSDNPDE